MTRDLLFNGKFVTFMFFIHWELCNILYKGLLVIIGVFVSWKVVS
jgi:hypothetical protein